jgi:hypothetical protein
MMRLTTRPTFALALALLTSCTGDSRDGRESDAAVSQRDAEGAAEAEAGHSLSDAGGLGAALACRNAFDCRIHAGECCSCPTLQNVTISARRDRPPNGCLQVGCMARCSDPLAPVIAPDCVEGRCVAFDVRTSSASLCSSDAECRVVTGELCPDCSRREARQYYSLSTAAADPVRCPPSDAGEGASSHALLATTNRAPSVRPMATARSLAGIEPGSETNASPCRVTAVLTLETVLPGSGTASIVHSLRGRTCGPRDGWGVRPRRLLRIMGNYRLTCSKMYSQARAPACASRALPRWTSCRCNRPSASSS